MQFMRDHVDFDLLAVVNSPGAALIGDDLKRIASEIIQDRPVIALESPGYSRHIWDGYSKACSDLIDRLVPSKCRFASDDDMKCVNLLGLSIFHKYYQGDIIELKRLLALCGIDVNCSLCCDCSVEEIKNLRKASLNVVVDPVYGLETAKILKQRYNMPYLSLPGLPVGFSDTERFIHTVSCALSLQSLYLPFQTEFSHRSSKRREICCAWHRFPVPGLQPVSDTLSGHVCGFHQCNQSGLQQRRF